MVCKALALNWFKSYLTNKTQYVKYKNCNSERNKTKCGVPQGSILGSLLFIIYINDIHQILSSIKGNFLIFADDTNVLYAGKNLNYLTISVNEELEKNHNWLSANNLFLTFQTQSRAQTLKESTINIKIKNIKLVRAECIKFLGVYLNDKLNWNEHLNKKAYQISKVIGIMNKIKTSLTKHLLKLIYFTLVHSHLLCGLFAWGNSKFSNQNRLLTLQKKQSELLMGAAI